jgi:hypothetical protein
MTTRGGTPSGVRIAARRCIGASVTPRALRVKTKRT